MPSEGGECPQISTFQVALSNSALNQGDVYILDKGLELFQWNGDNSSPFERNKAAQIVQAINSQRKGQVQTIRPNCL